jgi:pyruvate dehydrogenase E1 component beta subunit
MHSVFAHIPGLKVIMPTSPEDAKGMLSSAIRDDNPVIMLEHRWLYDIAGPVPDGEYLTPIGEAKVTRTGKDVTIVAVSWMNIEAMKAAQVLESKHGVEVEIVDPRTIAPLDIDPIAASVKKTGHAIVADYDWVYCGFASELAATLSENCFDSLRSPVTRIGFEHTPCPTTRPLENRFYPNAVTLIRTVENKLKLPPADLSGEAFFSHENKFKGPF